MIWLVLLLGASLRPFYRSHFLLMSSVLYHLSDSSVGIQPFFSYQLPHF